VADHHRDRLAADFDFNLAAETFAFVIRHFSLPLYMFLNFISLMLSHYGRLRRKTDNPRFIIGMGLDVARKEGERKVLPADIEGETR